MSKKRITDQTTFNLANQLTEGTNSTIDRKKMAKAYKNRTYVGRRSIVSDGCIIEEYRGSPDGSGSFDGVILWNKNDEEQVS